MGTFMIIGIGKLLGPPDCILLMTRTKNVMSVQLIWVTKSENLRRDLHYISGFL